LSIRIMFILDLKEDLEQDAASAIADVDKKVLDSRVLRASFGTTKYCSYFLRSVRCPNPDCMYLHELGTEDDSFTKEDMSQGKHLLTSARRVSKYHPNFMNGREFSNEDMGPTGSNLNPSLNKSVDQLPRVKVKKHHRSRSQGGESDHEENYYQEWQERFIDDSSDTVVQEKKVKRKIKEETHDVLFHWPKSFQAWFKLLLLDSSATPPLKMLNNFRNIWTIEGELTSQSRFAFARETVELEGDVFQGHMSTELNFSKIPEQIYAQYHNATSWAMKNTMMAVPQQLRSWEQKSQQKGNWNYDRTHYYEKNGIIQQNKWQQNYRDVPPGL